MTDLDVHPPDAEEGPHPIGDDPLWQESVFIVWRDRHRPIGGVFRVGHEPYQGGGQSHVVFDAYAGGVRYRRNLPSAPFDREADHTGTGLTAGDAWSFTYDGATRVRVRQHDCELALDVADLYPRTDFFPGDAGTMVDDFAAGHFEASGRCLGRLSLDGEVHEIDGWCHRDHSWGPRRWDTLLSHRWVTGSVGPSLSFGGISWHGRDGTLARFGYVVRNGAVTLAEGFDVTVHMACDALTYSGGEATWRLPGGETLTLRPQVEAAFVNDIHGIACVDAICAIEHDGERGFCDLEVSTNPRAGGAAVTQSLLATIEEGLSREEPWPAR